MPLIPYAGEIFAFGAAIVWSFAVILFRQTGERVAPFALNLFKNAFSLVLFSATILVTRQSLDLEIAPLQYGLLFISGALGIGLADILFLMTLNRMGAGLQSIIDTSYSPFIILFSFIFLGERLTPPQWLGVFFIISAVLGVGWMRGPAKERTSRQLAIGIALGTGSMLAQAISIVMIKPVLEETALIPANLWRTFGGVVVSLVALPLIPAHRRRLDSLLDRAAWPTLFGGAFLGTYVALLLWLAGMKYTQASIASVLNQTSTLWTFVLAAWLLKEPVTWRRVAGLVIGTGGVLLVTIG